MLLLPFAVWAAEPAYRIVHPDGTVEFTDQPVDGAEELRLPEAQGYEPPPPVLRAPEPARPQRPAPPPGYRTLTLASPQPEETIWANDRILTLSASVDPPLQPGHRLRFFFNGTAVSTGTSTSVILTEVDRGTHTASVAVVDATDSVISRSSPVTFYIQQHSILQRRR